MLSNYTVLIPVFNEAVRIIASIENFKSQARIIILIDEDDVETEKILNNYGVDFIRRPKGFNQWNWFQKESWMLAQSNTDYVLIAYASMYFPAQLLASFNEVAKEGKYDAVKVGMYYWSHGKLVQRPFLLKRASACYFFRKSCVNSIDSKIHAEFKLQEDVIYYKLKPTALNSIHVYRDDDMPVVTSKHIKYAEKEANERYDTASRVTLITIGYETIKSFLIGYVRMGGFLGGTAGFIFHLNFAFYIFMVYSRIWERQRNTTFEVNRSSHTQLRMDEIKKRSIQVK